MRAALALLSAVLCAGPASGQVVIWGGAGVVHGGYGPYLYGGYRPYLYGGYLPYPYGAYGPYAIVDPWAVMPLVPRSPDIWPSCYRYGRCSTADIAAYRYRVDRLERLAPSAPVDVPPVGPLRPAEPPPTAEEDIRPEYRAASVVKEEYRETGRPRNGRP
jgi:hypothetical protein